MIGAPIGTGIGTVGIVVRHPSELPDALRQHGRPVVIDNDEMERDFARLQKWQSRENTYRILAVLAAGLFAFAMANKYKIELSWRANWKLETLDGKITLTPMSEPSQADERSISR